MYKLHVFQLIEDLVVFLNTGNSGGPFSQAKIVTVNKDPGNGSWFVVIAP